MGIFRKKKISYHITEEEIKYIQDHTFNIIFDGTLYWLYSERMSMLQPYLQRKKRQRVSREDLLEYCKNQQIQVYPMTFRRHRIATNIASFYEIFKMYKSGLLIKSNIVIKLIQEYSKYCVANFPVTIPSALLK